MFVLLSVQEVNKWMIPLLHNNRNLVYVENIYAKIILFQRPLWYNKASVQKQVVVWEIQIAHAIK